jgi:hypothetical protein
MRALLATVLAAVACAPSKRPDIPAPQCVYNSDCPAPQICSSGLCVAQCKADRDCASGQTCSSGACVASNSCQTANDCPPGDVCNLGRCSAPAPECAVAADCGSGKACSPTGKCVASCQATSDCGANLTCSAGACVSTGPNTATIAGAAVYAAQSNSTGISVTLRGPGNAQTTTGASGAFTFAGLPPGLYTLTFSAPSSLEGILSAQVTAKAGAVATAATVTFTPVGELKGVVHLTGQTSALNVQVFVAGTSRGSSTDSTGAYDITLVPLGSRQVVASFPGFNPTSVTITVALGVNQVPDITLQPQVVINNAVFAFASVPPLQATVGHAYVYTAVAGGAGITGVTYSIAAGPSGMTIDAASGAVSFTPTFAGAFTVAIAATGGGAIIYQVYNLQVLSNFQQLLPAPSIVRDGDADGGVAWVVQHGAVTRFASPPVSFDAATPQRSAKTTSVSLSNVAGITGTSYLGGKVTSLSAPVGNLSATWPGGRVGTAAISNGFTAASTRLEGGTMASVNVPGLDTVNGALAFTSRTAQSIMPNNKFVPTSVTSADPATPPADTGIVTSVTKTVLTDTTQTWTTSSVGTRCLTNASTSTYFTIGSVTATTLTVASGDLTTAFSAGDRYFLTSCYSGTLSYKMTATGTFVAGRQFDIYLSGAYFGSSTIATGGTNSFTFTATIANYAALQQLPSSGFILVAEVGGYHLLTLNDSGGGFGALPPQTLGALGAAGTFVIDSNTATAIVFRVPSGGTPNITTVMSRLGYVLADAQGRVSANATLTTGGLANLAGKYLWNDSIGAGYPVISNTANIVTIGVPPQDLTGPWASAQVVPVTAAGASAATNPSIVITDQQGGLTTGAFIGRRFARRGSFPYPDERGTITDNGLTTVTFTADDCTSPCPGRVRSAQTDFPGTTWAATIGFLIRVGISISPSPVWAADSLIGRKVIAETNLGTSGSVASNQASSLVVSVATFPAADAFTTLTSSQHIYIADAAPQPYVTPTITVVVTDPNANWAPTTSWVGAVLVGSDSSSSTVGTVISNTATSVTVSAKSNLLANLAAGKAFALARTDNTPLCTGGQFNATVSLGGATLVASAYDTLNFGTYALQSFPVLSNDTATAVVAICVSSFATSTFGSLIGGLGNTAAFSRNGSIPVTLNDTVTSYTAHALQGYQVRSPTASIYPTLTVVDNAVHSITFNLSPTYLSTLNAFGQGASYYLSDPGGMVQLRLSVNATLTPSALVGRFVHALADGGFFGALDQPLPVMANDAGSVTANLTPYEINNFLSTGSTTLQLSAGVTVVVGDTAASFTPGALVGQVAQFAGRNLLVIANTAQSLTLATSDTSLAFSLPAAGASYAVPNAMAGGLRARALADGTAHVGLGNASYNVNLLLPAPSPNGTQAAIAKVGATGLTALFTPFSTGKQVQVTPRTPLSGKYTSLTGQAPFFTITDSGAAFAGNLSGAVVSIRTSFSWFTGTVVSNTSTTLRVYSGNTTLTTDSSQIYVVDTMRLDVTGGGLTARAYAGAQLSLQGVTYLVRDNDAGSLLVHRIGAAGPALTAGTGWLLTGLRGRRVNGIALSGSGFVAATDDGLAVFDGASWSRLGVRETSGLLATGTADDFTPSTVTCNACTFTPGTLAGGQLWLSDGAHDIQGNSAQVISLAVAIAAGRPPLTGDSFVVLDGRGLTSEANDVAVDGTTTWVPSGNGLLKGVGSTWSLLTAASTESSPGKGDGLPAATLTGAGVRVAGELWVASSTAGVARLSGTTWKQFTAAGTESAVGKGDGLPGDSIARITFDGARAWFAGKGAASFDGTAWAAIPFAQTGYVNVVVVASPGKDWLGTGSGLFLYTP